MRKGKNVYYKENLNKKSFNKEQPNKVHRNKHTQSTQ